MNRLLIKLKHHHRPIFNVLQWTIDRFSLSRMPNAFIDLFKCLSSQSPVCSYVPPNEFCHSLLESLCEDNVKANTELVRSVQRELPLFFNLLSALSVETSLPGEFKGLLLYLSEKSSVPFLNAEQCPLLPSTEETIYGRLVTL